MPFRIVCYYDESYYDNVVKPGDLNPRSLTTSTTF